MKMIPDLICDWDGTLCDSIPNSFRGTCEVFMKCNLPPPTLADYIANFGPPFVDFYRKRGVPHSVSEAQIGDWYYAKADHHTCELFDDVFPVICHQRSYGSKVALVTSQRQPIIEHLLEKLRCTSLFDVVICDALPDKAPHFVKACGMMRVKPEKVYCIGDFASDMIAAKVAGTIPIGIMRYDRSVSDILYRAGAARVITRLRDLIIKF